MSPTVAAPAATSFGVAMGVFVRKRAVLVAAACVAAFTPPFALICRTAARATSSLAFSAARVSSFRTVVVRTFPRAVTPTLTLRSNMLSSGRVVRGFFGQYPSAPRGPYLQGGFGFGWVSVSFGVLPLDFARFGDSDRDRLAFERAEAGDFDARDFDADFFPRREDEIGAPPGRASRFVRGTQPAFLI